MLELYQRESQRLCTVQQWIVTYLPLANFRYYFSEKLSQTITVLYIYYIFSVLFQ